MVAEEVLTLPDFAFENSGQAEAHIEAVISRYKQHINPGLGRLMQFGGFGDVEESAQGCVVRTMSGAEYLDFLGGYGMFAVGHRHPRVIEAVRQQLDRMPMSSRTFFSAPQSQLAERLAGLAPEGIRFAFFSNSGTEAVEAALKMARIASGKTDFVSTEGSYHGKTMGALAATGRAKYRNPFEPMVPGYGHVPFDDLEAMANAITDRTAAVIIEPVQGEGGIIVPARGYLAGLRKICDERGVLLIVDEVQTCMGRTGTMFACEQENVVPDILCLAKALGGGVMPIGATMATESVWDKTFGENPLIHTSTFGGNPLATVAALATIDVIEDENLCEASRVRGEQLLAGLRSAQDDAPGALREVRGRGLMVGVDFAVKDVAELTINGMARRGVIAAYTLNNPNVIRFEPPLIVTEAQVETAIAAFRESVMEAVAMLADLE